MFIYKHLDEYFRQTRINLLLFNHKEMTEET